MLEGFDVFSHNDEQYTHDEAEAVQFAFEELDESALDGSSCLVTIYAGTKKPASVKELVPDLADYLGDSACDVYGEHAEGWADRVEEKSKFLQTQFEAFVANFLRNNALKPDFYMVENIKRLRVRVFLNKGEYDGYVIDEVEGNA